MAGTSCRPARRFSRPASGIESASELLLLSATYWLLGSRPNEVEPTFVQDRMGHACEWETSMILKLSPSLVGDLKAIEPVPFGNPFEPATRGWITKDRSDSGAHRRSPPGQRRER